MRPTIRLFQSITKQGGTKRIIDYAQTGLAGLGTHPAPRPTLLGLYYRTLKELSDLPQESTYRQATESLTKQRLKVVEAVVPHGFDKYIEALAKRGLAPSPTYEGELKRSDISEDEINEFWSENMVFEPTGESMGNSPDKKVVGMNVPERDPKNDQAQDIQEPNISQEQVRDIEEKIGGGLIEEMIHIAYNELQLIQTMKENKV